MQSAGLNRSFRLPRYRPRTLSNASMEPPENELMRGERQMSEHELRFQRSLRNLNVPDWYKKSSKTETGLRRNYDPASPGGGWSGLNSKSTSKESLQSSRCTTPTGQTRLALAGRSRPADWRYVRGTSRESLTSPGSGATSPAPSDRSALYYPTAGLYRYGSARSQTSSGTQSPVGSAAGSLVSGGRKPYLGWRSQERLNQGGYQSPADRLATSLARNRSEGCLTGGGGQRLSLPRTGGAAASSAGSSQSSVASAASGGSRLQPPDMDVHNSIKEVTNAIVHYFDSASNGGSASDVNHRGGSPRPRRSPGARNSRSASPSKPRSLWVETAFVGSKPVDDPKTPEEASSVLADTLVGGGGGGMGGSGPSPAAAATPATAPAPAPGQAPADRFEFVAPSH